MPSPRICSQGPKVPSCAYASNRSLPILVLLHGPDLRINIATSRFHVLNISAESLLNPELFRPPPSPFVHTDVSSHSVSPPWPLSKPVRREVHDFALLGLTPLDKRWTPVLILQPSLFLMWIPSPLRFYYGNNWTTEERNDHFALTLC